jgi:FkbM family methyltransferase
MSERLRTVLSTWLPSRLRTRLAKVLRERDAASAAAHKWRLKAERRTERVAELTAAMTALEERVRHTREAASRRRRTGLPREMLAGLLRSRARHAPRLPGDTAAAEAREQRLVDSSPAYRAAVDDEPSRLAFLQRVEVEGLPWWAPCDERVPERADRVEKQGFPLHAILQTRELALGGVMIDIGANIGRTSIPRVILGDVRAVYAAEPEPRNYACLVQNVIEHGMRGFVLPDQVAIGAGRGEVRLRRSRYPGGHRVLYQDTRKPVETVTVPLVPLDEWLDRLHVEREAVSFVKVDTQGSELAVLRGAQSLLARTHIAWQLELDPALLRSAGADVASVLALVERHFTHFVDLGAESAGPTVRSVTELREALTYLEHPRSRTDILTFSSSR